MNSIHRTEAVRASRGRVRPRARTALRVLVGALAVSGGVAFATPGERYPGPGDEEVAKSEAEWRKQFAARATALCTGAVTVTGSGTTRDPVHSTPVAPAWTPLAPPDGGDVQATESGAGGDTDTAGNDSFLYVRLVAVHANVFCQAILEAEDGDAQDWTVRFRGTETVEYHNGAADRAESIVVTNPWAIGWSRRIVDFDALNGEFDEPKLLSQKFEVRCKLIDGREIKDGASFLRAAPSSIQTTSTGGLKLKAGVNPGGEGLVDVGIEPLFQASGEQTWDGTFDKLLDNSSPALFGAATHKGSVPCPYRRSWNLSTEFDADLSIHDHADGNGDKGSRQELLIQVVNYVSGVKVETCHACGTAGPPIPEDPSQTPRTPKDPGPVGDGTTSTTPDGPPVTPPAGEEPGFTPPTGPGTTTASGSVPTQPPPTAAPDSSDDPAGSR